MRVNEREVPVVTNFAGLNRVGWDLREDGPVRWNGAAKEEYRGPRVGATVVPGAYTVRIVARRQDVLALAARRARSARALHARPTTAPRTRSRSGTSTSTRA